MIAKFLNKQRTGTALHSRVASMRAARALRSLSLKPYTLEKASADIMRNANVQRGPPSTFGPFRRLDTAAQSGRRQAAGGATRSTLPAPSLSAVVLSPALRGSE